MMPVKYCGNTGQCELGDFSNGWGGFALIGRSSDLSGRSVSSVGDVNGDGIADLALGASIGGGSGGRTYVIFGSRNASAWGDGSVSLGEIMDGDHGFMLTGEASYDLSGYSVSGAGDINDDGITDLIIGAPHADPAGRVREAVAIKTLNTLQEMFAL